MGILYFQKYFPFPMRVIIALLLVLVASQAIQTAPAKRRLGFLPAWAKNALKGPAKAIIGTIIDCISQQVKSIGVAQLSKIPGVKLIGGKVVGGAIDKLTNSLKGAILGRRRCSV